MDLKAILKEQGYTDEQIQAILDAMGKNKIYTTSVENPEETIAKLQEDAKRLEAENKNAQQKAGEGDESAAEMIKKLQAEVYRSRIETAAIIGLTKAGAQDVDYLMYKAEKAGELQKLKVDENGKVTGTDELVDGLKKSHAAQFAAPDKQQEPPARTGIKKLENSGVVDDEPKTLEEAISQKLSMSEE